MQLKVDGNNIIDGCIAFESYQLKEEEQREHLAEKRMLRRKQLIGLGCNARAALRDEGRL